MDQELPRAAWGEEGLETLSSGEEGSPESEQDEPVVWKHQGSHGHEKGLRSWKNKKYMQTPRSLYPWIQLRNFPHAPFLPTVGSSTKKYMYFLMYIINIYVFIYWILPHFEKFLPDQSYHKLFCTDVPSKIPVTWRNFCLEFCFLENATFLWDEAFKGDELGAGAAGGTAGAAASCACSLADTTPWQFRTETPSSWEWQKISRIEKISHCCRQMCHELKLFCSSYYSCK